MGGSLEGGVPGLTEAGVTRTKAEEEEEEEVPSRGVAAVGAAT